VTLTVVDDVFVVVLVFDMKVFVLDDDDGVDDDDEDEESSELLVY
jgi:hypothetical protein